LNSVALPKKILYNFRRGMVERHYKIKSYRKTACEFRVNIKTVLRWVKRYQCAGLAGLKRFIEIPPLSEINFYQKNRVNKFNLPILDKLLDKNSLTTPLNLNYVPYHHVPEPLEVF